MLIYNLHLFMLAKVCYCVVISLFVFFLKLLNLSFFSAFVRLEYFKIEKEA